MEGHQEGSHGWSRQKGAGWGWGMQLIERWRIFEPLGKGAGLELGQRPGQGEQNGDSNRCMVLVARFAVGAGIGIAYVS